MQFLEKKLGETPGPELMMMWYHFNCKKWCGGVGCKDDYLAPLERVL